MKVTRNEDGTLITWKDGVPRRQRHFGDTTHPNFPPHGTYAGHRSGCRCEDCVEGARIYRREYMRKRRESRPDVREQERQRARVYLNTPNGRASSRNSSCRRYNNLKTEPEYLAIINAIYKACPAGYQVDHITPFAKGGLHRPDNLQYLPGPINNKKKARLDFDCSEYVVDWKPLVPDWRELLLVKPPKTRTRVRRAKRPETPGATYRGQDIVSSSDES